MSTTILRVVEGDARDLLDFARRTPGIRVSIDEPDLVEITIWDLRGEAPLPRNGLALALAREAARRILEQRDVAVLAPPEPMLSREQVIGWMRGEAPTRVAADEGGAR